jgi:hypothetical protein
MSTGAKVAIALGTVTAVGAAWTYRDKIAKWFGGDQ